MNDIAALRNREGLDTQALLFAAAADWREAGLKVAGVLAEETADGECSAGFLHDIGSGRRYSMKLDEAPAGTSCHLDPGGVEEAMSGLLAQIAGADIVLLSKFGKLEGMQKGLWRAFSAAAAVRKPVLTTVSPKHVESWTRFAPAAEWIAANRAAIDRWCEAVREGPEPGAAGGETP